PVFHTIVSIKNDGHYFCRAGGNRPDGLNEPVTFSLVAHHKHCGFHNPFCYLKRMCSILIKGGIFFESLLGGY
uniref:hypothetical protein n=1 Tax=Escherichia coli TaxID=562 RepID=UPI001B3567B8